MHPEKGHTHALDRTTSWAALLLLIVMAALFACCVPYDRDALETIYKDFKMQPTWPMAIAFGVPTAAIVAGMAAVVLVGLLVQIRSRSMRSAAMFHLLLIVALGVLFLAFHEAMGSGMISLVQSMNGPAVGR